MQYDLRLVERTSFADIVARAAWAERHGMVGIWTAESAHDPFLPLVIAARETETISLGTGIAVAFGRSPFVMAQTAWDLQRLSDGRFHLGLGSQIETHIRRRFSQPWHGALRQMREYVDCVRHIWNCWQTGERPSFRGEIYRVDHSNPEFEPPPLPAEHARIPIWLAAVGTRMAALAGEIGDGIHVHGFHTEPYLRDRYFPAAFSARESSAPLQATSPVLGGVAHDERERAELVRTFRARIAFYASTPAYAPVLDSVGLADVHAPLRARSREGRWEEMADLVPDDAVEAFAVIDEPRALGVRLRRRYEGLLTQLSLYRGGARFMTEEDWEVFLTALADE